MFHLRSLIFLLAACAYLQLISHSPVFADGYDSEWENVSKGKSKDNPTNFEPTEDSVAEKKRQKDQESEAEEMEQAAPKQVRKFHEVLDDLLAEFGYDVRKGQINGLKNLSIRRVEVSDALPVTYRNYVEVLVSERIRENSRVRLVACIPCRTKTSHLVEGKLMITSPTTNMDSMREAAQQLGVETFMDVILVYHTSHMVLAFEIFNATTQELVWSRTYNSETIKSRFQKLAVDYQQVEKSRPGEDYTPEYRYIVGVGGGIVPNVTGKSDDNGVASFLIRATERFNNRRDEFGVNSNIYLSKSSFTGGSASSTDSTTTDSGDQDLKAEDLTPWKYAVGLWGMYAHNFIGELESYNEIRHGANLGLGFIATSNYLTTSARFGWDIYFGRRFVTNFGVLYLMPSTASEKSQSVKVAGGAGGDLAISFNF